MKLNLFLLISVYFFSLNVGFAQSSEPRAIKAYKVNQDIMFDGVLSDSIWQKVPHISNFTQRDLDFGKPVTERTEVAVIYDKHALYFGVWCYQKDASKIVAKNMKVDFNYREDDNFQIMISPFNDNRNGYLFVTNPNGARCDVQIYGGEDGNKDWNAVWDVKTTVNDKGWFAEVMIPFNALQFKKDSVLNWALNFERDIVSENQQALWQGWSRDNSIYSVVKAGRLTDLKDISYAKRFELKPYVLTGWSYNQTDGSDYPFKFGANLNVNLSPTLKLNLTSYTDFAQVEADRIPVNLSRFSIYYPEKRQFFLEGYDLYSFYLGDRNNAFYSREIGIENGKQVPIIGGARMFGKIGKNNIGFLNIQEGQLDTISSTNNTVLRYKRDIGEQSYIGGFFSNVINSKHSNQVLGLDATYETSKFLNNKNIVVSARASASTSNFDTPQDAYTYRLSVDYPNDLIDNFMAIGSMQKGFNPELGYIRRTDYDSYTWMFRLTPRMLDKYGIKRMLFKPWGFTIYRTHSTGELESFTNEIRPLAAELKTGDRSGFNLIQNYDRIDEPFMITDEIVIPAGKYMMYQYEIGMRTYRARRIWANASYKQGDFYTGEIKTFSTGVGVNVSKNLNVSADYSWNDVKLPQGNIVTHEMASYINYAFTTKLNFSLFGQYNSLNELMIYNIRLHWIPKIGSDFYFVYNIGYEEPIKQIEYLKPQTTSAVVKLIYRITF